MYEIDEARVTVFIKIESENEEDSQNWSYPTNNYLEFIFCA